jgi:four helix bundle protein
MKNEPAKAKSYKELTVWQQARKLTNYIYNLTRQFPPEKRYDLVSQMRRAAVSIPSWQKAAAGNILKTPSNFSLSLGVRFTK